MSHAHDSQLSDWVEPFPGANYLRQTLAVAEADVRKLIHDPVELLTRMVQPVLWLLIFGQVFNRTRAIPTGGISYLDFMAPGILAQSVLFGAIFYGISLIWERDLGIVQKFLVSPAPRSTLVLGRAISSTVRSLCQMVFVYAIAFLLHVQLRFGVFELAGVVLAVMLGFGRLFHVFPDYCVPGEIARTVHGHRPSADHAAILREQRNLSAQSDAVLAARRIASESSQLPGGCPANFDDRWRRKFVWTARGLPDASSRARDFGRRGDQTLSEHRHLILPALNMNLVYSPQSRDKERNSKICNS